MMIKKYIYTSLLRLTPPPLPGGSRLPTPNFIDFDRFRKEGVWKNMEGGGGRLHLNRLLCRFL